jgi:hypothetical protein
VCRSTIGQTRADSKATMAAYHQDSLHPTASRWAVRLPQRIYLSKPVARRRHQPRGRWTGEYVLGPQAAQALRASGLTGFELRPVLHHKNGEASETGEHLVARALLPAALEDGTTFETFDDGPRQPSTPRRYGLLAYPAGALAASPDLARTRSPGARGARRPGSPGSGRARGSRRSRCAAGNSSRCWRRAAACTRSTRAAGTSCSARCAAAGASVLA